MKWIMMGIGIIALLVLLFIFVGIVIIYEIDREEYPDEK